MSVVLERSAPTSGSANPAGDRRFRPDIQGLRAVAILVVVLFHAGVPGFGGGFVGVDVFFVISGFVITGVLLRERDASGRTSIPSFYGRRARRIIPAATLVIIVTVVAAYHSLGSVTGHETAVDGRWAAVFLANFHFAASSTNYLASQRPPSALQNYWSLAVEEQFYIVYPAVFVLAARWARRLSLRGRLALVLVAVIAASFTYSVLLTPANPSSAFFSPLTRAWELALGGLIALGGDHLRRVPPTFAALASWAGLAAIAVADLRLTSASVYPGSLVAIPVLGAGLVIAGGVARPRWGAELLLRQGPFQFLGLISYSLYLWHWPILVIAAQSRGATTLPVWDNVWLLLLATALATVTYWLLENPVRRARILVQRRWASIALGLVLIGATLVVTSPEEPPPGLDLGSIATVASGSVCPATRPAEVSHLRSVYEGGRHPAALAGTSASRSVVVIGDSTSCTMFPGLAAVGPSYGLQMHDGSLIGCGIVSGRVAPFATGTGLDITAYSAACQGEANNAETAAIDRYHPQLVVWGSTDERNGIEVGTRSGTKILEPGSAQWRSVMLRRMDDRVNEFIAAGARVVLLEEPPSVQGGSTTDVEFERMNTLLREVSAQHPHRVGVVDLETRLCPAGPPCPYVLDGQGSTRATVTHAVRPDGIHYSLTGALWVARWLVPRIAAEARSLS